MAERPPDRCQAETRSGQRCSALAVDGVHCPWHSVAPEWVEKLHQWSAKGGERRSNASRAKRHLPAEPMTAAELHAYLGVVFKGVVGGKLEPAIATAAANVARTIRDVGAWADVEARLAEVERRDGRSA